MNDEGKGDLQIYQYFSDCLKIFRHRMLLLCKISNTDQQQIRQQLQSSLTSIISEGTTLLNRFEEIQKENSNLQSIFSRFLLRVRQSVHTISIKASSNEVTNFLKFIQNILKQFSFSTNMWLIMKMILVKVPKYKISSHILSDNRNIQSSQCDYSLKDSQKQPQQTISPQAKSQKHFDYYDKYLQALECQYRLFDCLNIERSEYRRVFFLALEDKQRKDNNLLEEMMYRNRFTKQSISAYQRNFQKQLKKQSQKRLKSMKNSEDINYSEQLKVKQISKQNIIAKIREENYQSFSAPKRLKSQIETKTQKKSIMNTPTVSQPFKSFQSKKTSVFRQRMKTTNTPPMQFSTSEELIMKNKLVQMERQKISKNANVIQLKKIQFVGNIIELAPQDFQKKPSIFTEEQRKKHFYKKTQQHFRKKISIVTQTKLPKQQSYKSQCSPIKNTKYNSIKIEFARFNQQ